MANENSNTPNPGQQPQKIPLSKIHDLPGVYNPKPVESKLGSMIISIQKNGVMEPVILRDRGDGEYQLLSGYRRRRASELAEKKDIPAFVYQMTVQEAIAYRKAVKENPKAPIPGKLVDPSAKGKGGEKPAEAGKDAAGKDKPDQPTAADKGKGGEKPAEAGKDAAGKDKPDQPNAAAKGKDGEKPAEAGKDATDKNKPKGTLRPTDAASAKQTKGATEKKPEAPPFETAIKGSASTAIKQVLEDRLDPPGEDSLKSIPVPGDGESIFVTLHPGYLEKSPLNTFSVDTTSENFKELCKSIELVGIKDPVLARFNAEGKLEILSGQRRHLAATTLNRAVPTIIQKIDDADAKILVADGNLHRDKISSYDLSRALRMKMEGMKQKAGRRKKGYAAAELQSDAKLAQEMGMSIPKLNRYIHLSEAVKGVCDLVDEGRLTISVASEIAYLKKGTQESILHLMDLGYKPTTERIQRIKKAENSGKKPDDTMLRTILDDKDIAPKQPPQAPQQTGAAQPAPAAGTAQPSSAPTPETIPPSPDVTPQAPGGTDAPANTGQPTAGPAEVSNKDGADNPFEGKQERPEETKIVLKGDRLRKYFPDVTMTPRAIEESIYSALEERRQRQIKQQQKPNLKR